MFECPIRLQFFGPSNPAERDRVEKALKADKLVKATQLKQTKKEAEALRIATGLKGGGSTHGVGGEPILADQVDLTLEDLMKKSDASQFRNGEDAIKTLAIGEDDLSKMPFAEQPAQLAATLLPYQLQVRSSLMVPD